MSADVEALADILPLGYDYRDPYSNVQETAAAVLQWVTETLRSEGEVAEDLRARLWLTLEVDVHSARIVGPWDVTR